MRKLLLCTGMIALSGALSGCSFLGIGGHKHDSYKSHHGTYGHTAAPAPSSCQTGQCLARWNLEGGLGTAFPVGGKLVDASGTNAGSGAALNDISYGDAYDQGFRAELGGSYALAPNTKITGMGFIEEADSAGPLDWGTVNGQELRGGLSDYKSIGAEIGLRQYFAPRSGIILDSVRPYVEGRVGLQKVDEINIENATLGGAAFAGGTVPYYEDDWVGSAAGLVGVETPVGRYTTLALESGLRYQDLPKTDGSAFPPGSPLAGSNNGSGRLSVPLMLRGRYRF